MFRFIVLLWLCKAIRNREVWLAVQLVLLFPVAFVLDKVFDNIVLH